MARPSLFSHRKFRRLAMRVGSKAIAAGSLELIWHAAYESGDSLVGTPEEVEYLADWSGEPGVLAEALVEAGFLDQLDDGQLEVHDLLDHAPDYVRKRLRREQERRGRGQRPDVGDTTPTPDRTVSGQCPVGDRPLTPTPAPAPAPTPAHRDTLGGARRSREEVGEADAPAPADEPPGSPEDQIPTRDGKTWWPTRRVLERLRREYPEVDIEAVARDMARKIRAGARRPYTARGMPRAFASWVAAEAKRQAEERARSGPKRGGFDPHVGRHDGPPRFGFAAEDLETYREHPRWDAYLDECAERYGWGGELGEWPRFLAWLAERGEEIPVGGVSAAGSGPLNGRRTIRLVGLLKASNRAHDSGQQEAAELLSEAAEKLRDPGVDPIALIDELIERLGEVGPFGGLSPTERRAAVRNLYGLEEVM